MRVIRAKTKRIDGIVGISPVGDTITSAEAAIVASLIDRLKEKIPTALVVAG